jgi:hypothetical protein
MWTTAQLQTHPAGTRSDRWYPLGRLIAMVGMRWGATVSRLAAVIDE